MANPSLQIGNDNWAIKEDNLLGYSTAGTRFVPQPITMTRATASTRVNPSGLVEDVALLGSELVTNGDFATDSDWDKTGTWSIESNYATANGNSTSQYIQQDFTITNGKTYLFTYEIIENTLNGNGSSLSGSGGFVSVSLSSVIGTHQVYITADDSGAVYALKIGVSGTATTGTIKLDNVSVKEATIDNLPRVDYTDGTSSLLVEPQRTNLVTYSEDFSNAYFQKIRSTISTDQIVSPDGILSGDKFIEDSALGTKLLWTQDEVISIGDKITWSVFAKKGEREWIMLRDTQAGNFTVFFDLENGVIGTSSGVDSSKIEDYGSGWYRCSITYTSTTTTARGRLYLADANSGESYQGNGTSGLYIWGAQLEAGSYPTSYIPTSGSTVTRNQETYTKTGISDKINSTEGVLFVEMAALSDDLTNRFIALTDTTANNSVSLFYGGGSSNFIRCEIKSNNITQAELTTTSYQITNYNKIAILYKQNDFALWVNGTNVATDTSGNTPIGLNDLSFDRADALNFFGKVKQLQVFKTALSPSELTTLTT